MNTTHEKSGVKVVSNSWSVQGRKLISGIEHSKHDLVAEFDNNPELPERLFLVGGQRS